MASISIFVQGPSTRTELLVSAYGTVLQLRQKAALITGIPIASQQLSVDGASLSEDGILLGDCLRNGCTLTVSTPDAQLQHNLSQFSDLSSAEKFELSQQEYDARADTVRAFKKRNKLGRFADKDEEEEDAGSDSPAPIPSHIRINERFEETAQGRRGVIKFAGVVPELPGTDVWVGVEFDEPVGKSDGTVQGRRVFDCAKGHGGFFRPDKVLCGPQYVDRFEEEMDL